MKKLISDKDIRECLDLLKISKVEPSTQEEQYQRLLIKESMRYFIQDMIKRHEIEHMSYVDYNKLRLELLEVGKQFNMRLIRPTKFIYPTPIINTLEALYIEVHKKEG